MQDKKRSLFKHHGKRNKKKTKADIGEIEALMRKTWDKSTIEEKRETLEIHYKKEKDIDKYSKLSWDDQEEKMKKKIVKELKKMYKLSTKISLNLISSMMEGKIKIQNENRKLKSSKIASRTFVLSEAE